MLERRQRSADENVVGCWFFFSTNFFLFFFPVVPGRKRGKRRNCWRTKNLLFFFPFSSFPTARVFLFFFAAIPFCSFHGKWSTCGGVSVRCSTDYVGKWKQQKKTVPPKKKQSNRFLFLKKKRNVLFLIKVGLGTNRNSFLDRKTSFHHLLVFVLEDTRFYLVLPSFT